MKKFCLLVIITLMFTASKANSLIYLLKSKTSIMAELKRSGGEIIEVPNECPYIKYKNDDFGRKRTTLAFNSNNFCVSQSDIYTINDFAKIAAMLDKLFSRGSSEVPVIIWMCEDFSIVAYAKEFNKKITIDLTYNIKEK